jgi:hypothetical protein
VRHAGGQILPQQARIAELEGTMEGLHAHIRALEEELASRSSGQGDQVTALPCALVANQFLCGLGAG